MSSAYYERTNFTRSRKVSAYGEEVDEFKIIQICLGETKKKAGHVVSGCLKFISRAAATR